MIQVDLTGVPENTKVLEHIPCDPEKIDITEADRIVSAGKGAGSCKGVRLVQELARSLKASLAASRMAVDLGWVSFKRQVGQTGKTVKPKLYVACGISGASHHILGMRESQHIIAINSDQDAPIHQIAHASFKTDMHQLIPEILIQLKQRRSSIDAAKGDH